MGWGVLNFALRVLDIFGKGESAVDIYKLLPHFIQFLGNLVFSGLAIAAGFAGLIWVAVREAWVPSSIPVHQLVHPDTKLPVSSKLRIWPKIKRPVWTCVLVFIVALLIWSCYKTPLRNLVFIQQFPKNVIPIPLPPVIEASAPKENPSKGKVNPVAPPVKIPMAQEKPTIAPSQSTQAVLPQPQNRPANLVPIPASAPLACPAPGTLAQGWTISLQQMMGSGTLAHLPVENGPISFSVQIPDQLQPSSILHPLLNGKVRTPNGPFRGSQIQDAEELLEDLKSQVGPPAPLPYRSVQKPERFISYLEMKFQNPQTLAVGYVDGTKGSSEAIQSGNVSVPITSLSRSSQEFINKLNAKAKTDADQSCKDVLKNLTQDE
jgi:hypothetical protein